MRDKLGIKSQVREWMHNIQELTTTHKLKTTTHKLELLGIGINLETTIRLK
jgi:hypothetical protein